MWSIQSSALFYRYTAALLADNVLVVTAAGNRGNDSCLYSPGASASSLTVGATNANDEVPAWSNYGRCVKIHAPGDRVCATSSALCSCKYRIAVTRVIFIGHQGRFPPARCMPSL